MSKLRRARPSPAMVVSVIALVAALAGTAYAAKINGGSIVRQSIGGGKLKKNTLSGFQIKTSKLGTVPAAKRATHTYWAVVNNPGGGSNASLVRSSDARTSVLESGGAVVVTFPAVVSGCANVAGKNNSATGNPPAGFAQTNSSPTSASSIEVRTRDDTGANVDGDFHLIVICP
ncbi:MAG: hypothetical protein AABM29_04260 [Actinomycetota bacterium]